MQLRKMAVLAALGAATLFTTGCGDDDDEPTTCSEAGTTAVECSGEEPTCGTDPADTSRLICLCTATSCNDGRRCEASTGQCVDDEDGTGGTSCDPATQPGTCSYGEFCAAGNSCQSVPEASAAECPASAGAPTWNRNGLSAPVITSISATRLSSTNTTTQCGDGGPAGVISINFYAPNGLTTRTTFAALRSQLRFRRPNSTGFDDANFAVQNPQANANQGSLQFGVCGNTTGPVAVHIQNEAGQTSNVVCTSW